MLRVFAALAVASVVTCVYAPQAQACECKEVSRTEAYDTADSVFYGKVQKIDDGVVSIKVSSAFRKAKRKRTVKLYPLDECGFSFEDGKSYLVFAKKNKKKLSVHACSGTTDLDFTPMNPVVWSLSDDMSYGLTKRQRASAETTRNKLADHASKTLKDAVRSCDKSIWKSKKNVKGYAEIRFDYVEKRFFTAKILKYETSSEVSEDITACLNKKLTKVKFPKFSGGPVSVHAYRLLDQIDPMMVRKKSNASVVAFGTEDTES